MFRDLLASTATAQTGKALAEIHNAAWQAWRFNRITEDQRDEICEAVDVKRQSLRNDEN